MHSLTCADCAEHSDIPEPVPPLSLSSAQQQELVDAAEEAMFACEAAVTTLLAAGREEAARTLLKVRTRLGNALPPLPQIPR